MFSNRLKLKPLLGITLSVFILFSSALLIFKPESKRRTNVIKKTHIEIPSMNISIKKYSLRDSKNLDDALLNTFFSSGSKSNNWHYTIVIPTYHRESLIKRAVKYYSNFKNVSKIIVVWFNEEKMPNDRECFNYVTSSSKVDIEFYWMPNFVRLRYFPYPTITTNAVFNVDDDMLIEEASVLRAFQYWKVMHCSFFFLFF